MTQTERVNSTYGAPLGRASDNLSGLVILERDQPFTLRRCPLDRGGYDKGGAYWGLGKPLFWWDIGGIDGYFRAIDRNAAKAHIRALHPHARFYC